MRSQATIAAIVCVVLGWLPYALAQAYWHCLLASVPGAEHSEISGPMIYFLPRLFVGGIVMTVTGVVVAAIVALAIRKYRADAVESA